MFLPSPYWIGMALGVSEAAVSLFHRSGRQAATRHDRGSLRLIWIAFTSVVIAALLLRIHLPQAGFVMSNGWYLAGLLIFCIGLLLRWYSILYLGKYFTVDVAIAADHIVVDTGPYRFIRHPSYSAVVLEFLGWAMCLGNVASLLLVMGVVIGVLLYRIRIEEAVLQSALGEAYTRYMRRTHRLIPFIY